MNRCDHCESYRGVAYTLTAHPESTDDGIDLYFCSVDCLRMWTGSPRSLTANPGHGVDDGTKQVTQ